MSDLNKFLSDNKITIINPIVKNRASIIYSDKIEEIFKKLIIKAKENNINKIYVDEIAKTIDLKIDNRIIGWWLRKKGFKTRKNSEKGGKAYIIISVDNYS